jgi:hypothetical protein
MAAEPEPISFSDMEHDLEAGGDSPLSRNQGSAELDRWCLFDDPALENIYRNEKFRTR